MFLSGVSNDDLKDLQRPDMGLMCQPGNSYHLQIDDYPKFGADNGCFTESWNEKTWLKMLDRVAFHSDRCLFAVVPDVFHPDRGVTYWRGRPEKGVGDHRATLERWHQYHHEITDRGLPAAFVAQNGCTPDDIPTDASVVFIGGNTVWKLSERAWAIVATAKAHGLWVHMGRVNSLERLKACNLSGVDSADGTFLKWGPDINLPRLVAMLDHLNTQPHLALFGGTA